MTRSLALVLLVGAAAPGCTLAYDPDKICEATELADDFRLPAAAGEAGDPTTWIDLPDDAVVAGTFLRIAPSGYATYGGVIGGILDEMIAGPDGLLEWSAAQSASCLTGRTLTVWEDEAAMMDFVVGEAHSAALAETATISRGGSITDHWLVSELDEVSYEGAAAAFGTHDGPIY